MDQHFLAKKKTELAGKEEADPIMNISLNVTNGNQDTIPIDRCHRRTAISSIWGFFIVPQD